MNLSVFRRPLPGGRWIGAAGFTLLELLVVLGVIAVLAAITLSVAGGARERAARERASAELAVMAMGLERYRATHGAYPQMTGDPVALWSALQGRLTPTGGADDRRPFITLEGLTTDEAGTQLVDPWGAAYHYQPFRSGVRRGYHLYSRGPDGVHVAPSAAGVFAENADENLDNVFISP